MCDILFFPCIIWLLVDKTYCSSRVTNGIFVETNQYQYGSWADLKKHLQISPRCFWCSPYILLMEKKYNLLKNITFQFNSMSYKGCTAWILIDSVLELWEGYEEEILDLHWLSAQITNKKHITLDRKTIILWWFSTNKWGHTKLICAMFIIFYFLKLASFTTMFLYLNCA